MAKCRQLFYSSIEENYTRRSAALAFTTRRPAPDERSLHRTDLHDASSIVRYALCGANSVGLRLEVYHLRMSRVLTIAFAAGAGACVVVGTWIFWSVYRSMARIVADQVVDTSKIMLRTTDQQIRESLKRGFDIEVYLRDWRLHRSMWVLLSAPFARQRRIDLGFALYAIGAILAAAAAVLAALK
jgi:hypothetical protein